MKVLFSPHNDDAALFAAYTLLRHRPHVVTVLRSELQWQRGLGITAAQRQLEDDCAFRVLGLDSWAQWPYSDVDPDWGGVENAMRILDERVQPETVFAPAPELGGHDDHNQVGDLAEKVFGADRVAWFLTYRRGEGRSVGVPVDFQGGWGELKQAALDCYVSQIAEPSTAAWFADPLRLLEYVPANALLGAAA